MAADPMSLPEVAWTAAKLKSTRSGSVACLMASARNARVSSMLLGPQSVYRVTSGSLAKECTASSSVATNARSTNLLLTNQTPPVALIGFTLSSLGSVAERAWFLDRWVGGHWDGGAGGVDVHDLG
jgi:hypothetical protein